MSEELPHEYDGIREYDNPLPGWWKGIFYGSIVFAVGYWLYYQVGGWGQTPAQAYEVAELMYRAAQDKDGPATATEQMLATGAGDASIVDHGHAIFVEKCATCHTADGHGLIGPNLTDLYQIHGTKRVDLFQTIRDGAPGTAMMAWGTQLPHPDLLAVASFVTTLRGKNLPGKAPQGQPVPPFAK